MPRSIHQWPSPGASRASACSCGCGLILEELDLTYLIQDEVLKITSKEKADEVLITQVYRLNGVVSQNDRTRHTAQLIDLITSTIQPDSWQDQGGPGSIDPFRGLLVVSQKLDVHEEIQRDSRLRLVLPREEEAGEDRRCCRRSNW